MRATGWVLDPGANRGLFSVWAALAGTQAIAVQAQQGFEPEIRRLAAHNGVSDRVHVEIALAGGRCHGGSNCRSGGRRPARCRHLTRRAAETCRRVGFAAHVGLPDRHDRVAEVDIEGRRVRGISATAMICLNRIATGLDRQSLRLKVIV